ncbi:nucleotide-binding universal stress UspA family protein [Pseudoalteromonas sp. MBR-15]|jgi:nucleotide-binding universal stress UspA family protein
MISPKLILMPLSTSGHVTERLKGGLAIAKYFNAHIDVYHTHLDPKRFLPTGQLGLPTKLLKELDSVAGRFATTESTNLKAEFVNLCAEQQVKFTDDSTEQPMHPSASLHINLGLRSEIIAEQGKVADLIIIPQSKSGKSTSTFEASVMRSGKPILLVPRQLTHFDIKTVVIAWNASTEVSRALTYSLALLKQATKVVICTSSSSADKMPNGYEVVRYLAQHDIKSEFVIFNNGRQSTVKAFMSVAQMHNADLVVMGAFTHRRIHEQVFGGMTNYMLAKTPFPILMAR